MKPTPAAARMSGEDRRRQIIQTAVEIFSKHGFSGATTKQIAEAAGVSEAIIFRHFATKQDLYTAILDLNAKESGRDQGLEELRELTGGSDDEKVFHAVARGMLKAHRSDPQFYRLMIYAALEGHEFARMVHSRRWPFQALLREYILKRQKAGALRKGDPELMVFALIGMPAQFALVTQTFGFHRAAISDEEAARTFTKIFLDGARNTSNASNGKASVIPLRSPKYDVHVPNR